MLGQWNLTLLEIDDEIHDKRIINNFTKVFSEDIFDFWIKIAFKINKNKYLFDEHNLTFLIILYFVFFFLFYVLN